MVESSQIGFLQWHKPSLKAGEYEITVTQEVKTVASAPRSISQTFDSKQKFSVRGPRFALSPQEIVSVFPPQGSLGDHADILPHVILRRSTLPWERSAKAGQSIPWLAVLLFSENEIQADALRDPQVLTLQDLNVPLESGQKADQQVMVLEVKRGLLEKILPLAQELEFLVHARQVTGEESHPSSEERAVVFGNRLPRRGSKSIVHLVSLEGRYNGPGFDFQGAKEDDFIRLVSLKTWHFSCEDPQQNFTGLLKDLNREPGTLRLSTPLSGDTTKAHRQIEEYHRKGYVSLRHAFRRGGKTVSWYRGPLVPGIILPSKGRASSVSLSSVLPVRCADQLVIFHPENRFFDVSYAAAWELGKLLMLQDKHLALKLKQWKRQRTRQLRQSAQILQCKSLSTQAERGLHLLSPKVKNQKRAVLPIPQEITQWFRRLSLLESVPFHYLVADQRLLPPESIRFFHLDPFWRECLLDGAFSVGRVLAADCREDQQRLPGQSLKKRQARDEMFNQVLGEKVAVITGFLVRSKVIAGWPELQIQGYPARRAANPLTILRQERLANDVLLCLFAGDVQMLDMTQKPESLHFGLDVRSSNRFDKRLRNQQGILQRNVKVETIPWRNQQPESGVISIKELVAMMKKTLLEHELMDSKFFTSAQFALQMITGAQGVRFVRTSEQ